jgi:hypothetical protein
MLPCGCPKKRKLPKDPTIDKSRTAKKDTAAAAVADPHVSSNKQRGKRHSLYKKWCRGEHQEDKEINK